MKNSPPNLYKELQRIVMVFFVEGWKYAKKETIEVEKLTGDNI